MTQVNDPKILADHGLTSDDYGAIESILGRAPNLLELGVFSVMWSEHCSYKSSKKHLSKFPTEAPWVICGPGENAGVVDIGDGDVAIFKMESHNHPSFIEPYQGAATGVGGILRDVFTMGARPVAVLNALRFGDPSHPKTRALVRGVVAGIGGYGNCVGVPTVGGEATFHRRYNGNILVNAMAVGVTKQDRVFYARAGGPGNPVVYFGAKTGRDGIHGATMASAEFDDDSDAKRPTVQVGDPFTEKLLIEACLELMTHDFIIGIQDMGAAGLTSSSFEMASRGETGITLQLDAVPMREAGMTPYEIMLSESQERMLMVVKAGMVDQAAQIVARFGLECAEIGRVTDTGRMELHWHGDLVADVPIAPVAGAAPVLDRPFEVSPERVPIAAPTARLSCSHDEAVLRLLSTPDLVSKRWIYEQYDQSVMGDTVAGPGGDAAVIRVHGTSKGLALTTDCTPRYCEASPVVGGRQAVAESYRNLISVGARPLAITNCLNFGNPERPGIMGQFVGCIEGMAEACAALDMPVVSGNVSLYNETNGQAILPTPNVGAVGLIDDLNRQVGLRYDAAGLWLLLLGASPGWMGSTLYWREIMGREEGAPPPVNLNFERKHGDFVQRAIADGRVKACHDLSDGGFALAAAELCLASGMGADIRVPSDVESEVAWLFGEDQGRYLLVCDEDDARALLRRGKIDGLLLRDVGRTGGDALTLSSSTPISVAAMREHYESWLPNYMGQPA